MTGYGPQRLHLVRVVLPAAGPEATEAVADLLRSRLDGADGDLEGAVPGTDAGEVWVSTPDVRRMIPVLRGALHGADLPPDSHFLVQMGELDPERFELR